MPEITITEGETAAKAEFTLTYGYDWTEAAKRGTDVAQADVSRVYFYVKTNLSDADAWLKLTDADSSQISWSGNKVTVHFPADTETEVGDGQYYELRIKFTDGTFLTAESGRFNVKESIVDTP